VGCSRLDSITVVKGASSSARERSRRAGLREELRAQGYRLTPQRQLVLEAVTRLGHGTPEEIAATVQQTAHAVNISTVYRTLELLEQLGLVSHTHLGHGAPTYHSADDADHVHLVCRECGLVTETTPDVVAEVVDRLAAEEGFQADVRHLAIFGICRSCRDEAGVSVKPTA
jgi:Fur family transcriptional regulator, ferric uptake regulator